MKYVILIHGNQQSRAIWDSMAGEVQAEGLGAYRDLVEELTASGELVATEALDPFEGYRLPPEPDQSLVTDLPLAEAKEFLAGFFLVDVASLERAVQIAGRIPEAPHGLVEVRPVITYDGLES